VMAYLETVHLIADAAKWRRLQTALLHKLTDESLEISDLQAWICAWLQENRVVYPGCETEVTERLVALTNGQVEMPPPLQLLEGPEPPSKLKLEPIPFPRIELPARVYNDAPAQQMALF